MNIRRIELVTADGAVELRHDEATSRESAAQQVCEPEQVTLPAFPNAAWRGVFADYREAMKGATEASDVFHFAALWARCAVALGRRTYIHYGMRLYPNVFVACFGNTGDRKTTAARLGTDLGSTFKIVRGGGSGEGLADEFANATPGEGLLLFAEEFSQVLRPGRWDGATLIPFLTQCFDCPDRYEIKFRKSPVSLDRPTPSLLAGVTPEWFWQDFRARDFQGGFGSRIFFFTGARKPNIPMPEPADVEAISHTVDALAAIQPQVVHLEAGAGVLWERFYHAWSEEEPRRDPLLRAAVQRIPAYILKLAMVYAADERTLPNITSDQLAAAVLVGRYGEGCAKELLAVQNAGPNPRKELERRIRAFVGVQPGQTTIKREIYKSLWRHYSDTEVFNRAFDSLVRAGALFTKPGPKGRILVSMEPFD